MKKNWIKRHPIWTAVIVVFIIIFISVGSSGENQDASSTVNIVKKTKPTRIPTPTLTANQFIEVHGKAMKNIDDEVINHDLQLATKCALIMNDVANGNTESLSSWSTAYDPIYNLDGQYATESNDIDEATASANYSEWESLEKADGSIESDLENTENSCDYLTQDPDPVGNISSYESTVTANKDEVDSLLIQRKSILSSLRL